MRYITALLAILLVSTSQVAHAIDPLPINPVDSGQANTAGTSGPDAQGIVILDPMAGNPLPTTGELPPLPTSDGFPFNAYAAGGNGGLQEQYMCGFVAGLFQCCQVTANGFENCGPAQIPPLMPN